MNSFKKKQVFSKSRKVYPPLFPVQPKSSPSSFKKKEKVAPEEPQLIFSNSITKAHNMCRNGDCLNVNIDDKDIGLGYCSTKCVVEHSSFLFNEWVFKRNYREKPATPAEEINVSNNPVPKAPDLVVVSDEFDYHSDAMMSREPLFNVLFDKYCNDNTNESVKRDMCHNNQRLSRDSSPEVVMISNPTTASRKRQLRNPRRAARLLKLAQMHKGDPITIVID